MQQKVRNPKLLKHPCTTIEFGTETTSRNLKAQTLNSVIQREMQQGIQKRLVEDLIVVKR